ncbi:MAG: type VI secretion system baseplate subunit TssE [Alphaproteobacteria bacterium]|nr:type VI secretion system baseplate subunit TssE [Alphaproteobacteria bacterium]
MNNQFLKNKQEALYLPCLLHRLTDLNPEEKKENVLPGVYISNLKKDIFENIEMILNSKTHPQDADVNNISEIENSVLFYGLKDCCGKSYSKDSSEKIRDEIELQIKLFEPRINPDTLNVEIVENKEAEKPFLMFSISGNVEVGELSEEIVFLSKLNLETGETNIKFKD